MFRAWSSLLILLLSLALAFGWRTVVQLRRHGDSGWRFGRSGLDRVVGALLFAGVALVVGAPIAALTAGSLASPWGLPALVDGVAGTVATTVGYALAVSGVLITLVAQMQMGASWRIGVQPGERTELVTAGLFSAVRNPIFTGMVVAAAGGAALVPNALALAGAVVLAATFELQVRVVEEPGLLAVHGDEYRRWAASAGRFVPGVGRGV